MAKSTVVFLVLAVLAVQSAVSDVGDTLLKRVARHTCDECSAPLPPPPQFPPPPPPPRFRSENWSGFARGPNSAPHAVFSGAAAAGDIGSQSGSEACSLASASGTAGANSGAANVYRSATSSAGYAAGSGQSQTNVLNGGNFQFRNLKESRYSYQSSGGKDFEGGSKYSIQGGPGVFQGQELGAQSGAETGLGVSGNQGQGYSGIEQQQQQLGDSKCSIQCGPADFQGQDSGPQSTAQSGADTGSGRNNGQGFSGHGQQQPLQQLGGSNFSIQAGSGGFQEQKSGAQSSGRSGAYTGLGGSSRQGFSRNGQQQQLQHLGGSEFSIQGGPGGFQEQKSGAQSSAQNGAYTVASRYNGQVSSGKGQQPQLQQLGGSEYSIRSRPEVFKEQKSGVQLSAQSGAYTGSGGNNGQGFSRNGHQQQLQQLGGSQFAIQGGPGRFQEQKSGAQSSERSGAYIGASGNYGQGISVNEQQQQQLGSFNGNGQDGQSQRNSFSSQGHSYSKENYVGSSSNTQSGASSGQGGSYGKQAHNEAEFRGGQQQVQSGDWQKESSSASGQDGTSHGASFGASANGYGENQSALNGALNLASQGLQAAEGCTTCRKSSYTLSNAESHTGDAIALSIGG